MSKKLAFKILVVFWAVALIVVGVIKYKNSRSCSSCQAKSRLAEAYTEEQIEMLKNAQAVLLFPDNLDPLFITEDTAYSRSDITAFSIAQPEPVRQDELDTILFSLKRRNLVNTLPLEYKTLLEQRKLAILYSKSGEFFIVALSAYLD